MYLRAITRAVARGMGDVLRARANATPAERKAARQAANGFRHTFTVGYVDWEGIPVTKPIRARINAGITRLESWGRRLPLPPRSP